MPHRNLLLTLILTAGVTPFLIPGQARAQPAGRGHDRRLWRRPVSARTPACYRPVSEDPAA